MTIPRNTLSSSQSGGITILVSLMLLVLLTIAAVGMSRNSFREIVTSGFSRQGAMTRNVADSGIEWSIHWIDLENGKLATSGAALQLNTLKTTLLAAETLAGIAKDISTGGDYTPGGTLQSDLKLPGPTGVTQGFTLGLTRMGKLPVTDISQGSGSGAFTSAASWRLSAILV